VLIPKMTAVALIRARLLAKNTTLYGFRISDTAPASRAYTVPPPQPVHSSARASVPNIPQDAALCRAFGQTAGTVKRFWFHNLPDDAVADADWVPSENIPRIQVPLQDSNGSDGSDSIHRRPGERGLAPTACRLGCVHRHAALARQRGRRSRQAWTVRHRSVNGRRSFPLGSLAERHRRHVRKNSYRPVRLHAAHPRDNADRNCLCDH
jgi:hypothetical protein